MNVSTTTGRRALIVRLTTALACAALLAGCGSSANHRARTASTGPRTTASKTTTTRRTTTTTTPLAAYRVKRGDTLTTISKQFRVSIAAIIYVNRVASPDRLTEGQVLRIPPTPPLGLVVTPSQGARGRGFILTLTGSRSAEMVKFEIDSPTGKFTGRAHTATVDGTVKATYQTSVVDPPGIYNVIATGNQGTMARASFRVVRGSTH